MLSSHENINVMVQISMGEDFDEDDLDRLARDLRIEIELEEDLPLESIASPSEHVFEPGGKGPDLVTWGALGIIIIQAALPKLLECLQAWSLRGQGRVIKAKIQKNGISIDVEYPLALSPDEFKKHIQILIDTLKAEGKKH